MVGRDLWPLVHAERAALADDLAGLSEEEWATPSLCTGLSVREVLAHLTAAASMGPLRWMAGVVKCRFDFDLQVAMLGETVVHGEDFRRPLGIVRDFPADTVRTVAEYYRGTDQVVVAKGRIKGLLLTAVDGPFTAASLDGTPVKGTTIALVMAMTGRTAYCDELSGEGAAVLRGA